MKKITVEELKSKLNLIGFDISGVSELHRFSSEIRLDLCQFNSDLTSNLQVPLTLSLTIAFPFVLSSLSFFLSSSGSGAFSQIHLWSS